MRSRRKSKISIREEWSPELAYAVGLLVADGCLSKDGRHIDLTSADIDLLEAFKGCLELPGLKISHKTGGSGKKYPRIQLSNVAFYDFLLEIGLTPAKSNTIGPLAVPDPYFRDFLRGYFDGDGSTYSYQDPKFPNSLRFYMSFTSGSRTFLEWLRTETQRHFGVKGYLSFNRNSSYVQLKFAKHQAVLICEKMYYLDTLPCLHRKRHKIQSVLDAISRGGEIGRRAAFRAQ